MVYKHRLAMLIFVQNSVICQPSESLLYIFFAIFLTAKKSKIQHTKYTKKSANNKEKKNTEKKDIGF